MEIAFDSPLPFLGIYPKESTPYFRDTGSSVFIAALFTIARKKCDQPRYLSADEVIMKMWFIYLM